MTEPNKKGRGKKTRLTDRETGIRGEGKEGKVVSNEGVDQESVVPVVQRHSGS